MYVTDIAHLHIYAIYNVYVPVISGCNIDIHIDKEIQLCGAYDRSTRCWPLLLGTVKAKVELLLDIHAPRVGLVQQKDISAILLATG